MNTHFLKTSKNLYKQSGKCEDQQQFKFIIEADMVSTHEGFTGDSPIYSSTSTPVKKPHARKSLCLFTNILDVKKKTATRRVGASKSKFKAIKYGNTPWALKQNRKVNSKINEQIKKCLYNWIVHHSQVVQSPIINNFLKVKMNGYTEPQFVPKLSLQVSIRELYNNLLSDAESC